MEAKSARPSRMGERCGYRAGGAHRRSEASAARLSSRPARSGTQKPEGRRPPRSAPFSQTGLPYVPYIKFDGFEIIVTRPGTDMMTAYRKAPDTPNLILTRSWENPTVMSPDISEFRVHALQAAVNKARELGWIV